MVKWILKLNIWIIFFTLIAYAAPFIKPSEVSFLMLVGVAYPWLLVLNLIFIGIWAVSRYRHWWYSAICILLGIGYFLSVFGVNYFKSKSNNTTLKIMTLNTLGFELPTYRKNKIEGYRQLNTFFEKENADVICLQEVAGTLEQFIKQTENFPFCQAKYPYVFRIKDNGMAFLSKYPIQSGDILPINKNGSNGCTYADILINDKTIRFYNIQLQSNEVSDIADNLANKGELDDKNSWFNFLKMLKRFRKCAIKREKESEQLAKHMSESPYPTILCGDMNDIPVSYTYHILSKDKNDTFKKAGRGSGSTYAGKIPALRIDYILADKKITPLSCRVSRVNFSDHYPVLAEVTLNF